MFSFKDQLKKDLDVFINPNEFAEEHNFDGVNISMVVSETDTDDFKTAAKYELMMDNIFVKTKKLYFKDGQVPFPQEGDRVTFDEDTYYVVSSSLRYGMVTVEISANMS